MEKNTMTAQSRRKAAQKSQDDETETRRIKKTKILFKSLLVPIDFSETSTKALDYAIALAREFGSQIRLLHVVELRAVFNSTNPSFADWNRQIMIAAQTRLTNLADEEIDELIPVNSEVQVGRAYKVICEIAREQKSDLIAIGTHGFTGLKTLLLGSTAERVIRHAPCSVLVIRRQTGRNAKNLLKPKKILVPTDFSEPATHALQFAAALARQYQAEIHLLFVIPVHYGVGEYPLMDYEMLAAEQKETGEKQLAEMSENLVASDITTTTGIRHGRPAVEINDAAADIGCDLIVISTHGRTGWEHVLFGSTTEEVVRHASCPVLVVRKK